MSSLLTGQLLRIQAFLDFEGARNPVFKDDNGPGRHGVAGLAIGGIFGFSTAVLLFGTAAGLPAPFIQWCVYLWLLSVFHAGEWYITAAYRPKELAYKSWIINHSLPYTAVQLASVCEFWLEALLFPSLKARWLLIVLSTILSIGAIGVRILGMAHCGENFDHIVMENRKEGHMLVTDGIYAYLRHPSYFGFFYWSVCAQLLLGNPLLTVGCAYASRQFFQGRIPAEEKTLVEIYGAEYTAFCQRTPIGIPFVHGHVAYVGKDAKRAD